MIQLQQQPGVTLAVLQRQVPGPLLRRVVPECCGLAWQALQAQGLRGGRNVALYWDDAIRLEAGVEMSAPFTERDGLVRSATPAGLVASMLHRGPYASLGQAHEALRRWCETNGLRMPGPRWELYGHWQAAWDTDPSRIETEVACLVTRP